MVERKLAPKTLGVCKECQKSLPVYFIKEFDRCLDGAANGDYPDTWLYDLIDHHDDNGWCSGSGKSPTSLKYT